MDESPVGLIGHCVREWNGTNTAPVEVDKGPLYNRMRDMSLTVPVPDRVG